MFALLNDHPSYIALAEKHDRAKRLPHILSTVRSFKKTSGKGDGLIYYLKGQIAKTYDLFSNFPNLRNFLYTWVVWLVVFGVTAL